MIELFIRHFDAIAGSALFLSFGGYVTWRIYRKQRFIAASDKFRNAILAELEGLYPTPAKWPSQEMQIVQILRDKFPKLEIAVIEFRGHVIWFRRKRFGKAWQEYHKDYYQYVPMTGESYSFGKLIEKTDTTHTYQDMFKHNVDALLKFAKQP